MSVNPIYLTHISILPIHIKDILKARPYGFNLEKTILYLYILIEFIRQISEKISVLIHS